MRKTDPGIRPPRVSGYHHPREQDTFWMAHRHHKTWGAGDKRLSEATRKHGIGGMAARGTVDLGISKDPRISILEANLGYDVNVGNGQGGRAGGSTNLDNIFKTVTTSSSSLCVGFIFGFDIPSFSPWPAHHPSRQHLQHPVPPPHHHPPWPPGSPASRPTSSASA